MRQGKRALLTLFCGLVLGVNSCGSVTWFVFWNTGTVDAARASGAVLVIGTPVTPLPASVALVGGQIPPGMMLMEDATVQGIPETSGDFVMDVEVVDPSGMSNVLRMEAQIE
jgi:hypothetical protein